MDYTSKPQQPSASHSLASQRLAKGYSLEDLAIATGLTIAELTAAENGDAAASHVQRIESVLR